MALWDLVPRSLFKSAHKSRREPAWAAQMRSEIQESKLLTAQVLCEQIRARGLLPRLADAEFKVFSQFGDDGILQYLVNRLDVKPHTFVEFGVDSYREANTRLLLVKDNWRGLIMDGSAKQMQAIQREEIYWRHDLTATTAFITRENINDLLDEHGFTGDIGVLSIDIDGNDYWVWEQLHLAAPVIVVVEYNSVFGGERPVAVPYDRSFQRTQAHWSNLYWGCSLAALCHLADKKGFAFVGSNSAGNNAYFVKREQLRDVRPLTSCEGYVESLFRDSRNEAGKLTHLSGQARRDVIASMPVVDVVSGRTLFVGEL